MPTLSIHRILIGILLVSSAQAQENRYDLLGRMLAPFVSVFATTTSNPNRALSMTLRLDQMTGLPANLAGSHAEISVEYPDKLRLRAPILGEELTVCRHGQEVWAFPGSKIEALLATAPAGKKLPKLDHASHLAPFTLPVPEKDLVFLPALFRIKDIGSEPVDGEPCRVMDLFLMPELARSLKAQDWGARVWVRKDAKPARISLAKQGWMVVVHIDRVEFAPNLPENTWEPTGGQAADVLKLDAARYQQLLESLVR